MKKVLVFIASLLLLVLFCCSCGLSAPITPSSEDQNSSSTESSALASSPSDSSSSASSSTDTPATPTPPQSQAPSTVPSDAVDLQSLPAWKRLYISNAQILSKDYNQYALIHINNDSIPELYMSGTSKSTILAMSTIDEHATTSHALNAINTAYYIPQSGKIMNVFVDGDHLTMAIYRFEGNLQLVFQGFEYSVILEDGSVSKLHYINGKATPVSEDALKAAVAEHFDTAAAIKISDHFMSLDELKTAILNW